MIKESFKNILLIKRAGNLLCRLMLMAMVTDLVAGNLDKTTGLKPCSEPGSPLLQ
jgi:hypothetical protein